MSLVREGASSRLEELIGKLRRLKGSQVVILIDEYDKPILDNILARDEVLKIRTLLRTARSTFFALRGNEVERAVPGTSRPLAESGFVCWPWFDHVVPAGLSMNDYGLSTSQRAEDSTFHLFCVEGDFGGACRPWHALFVCWPWV